MFATYQMTIDLQGRIAYLKGHEFQVNPYPPKTPEYRWWCGGWTAESKFIF